MTQALHIPVTVPTRPRASPHDQAATSPRAPLPCGPPLETKRKQVAVSAQRRRRVLVAVVAAVIAAGAFYVAMTYKTSPNSTASNQTAPTATPVPTVSVVEVST